MTFKCHDYERIILSSYDITGLPIKRTKQIRLHGVSRVARVFASGLVGTKPVPRTPSLLASSCSRWCRLSLANLAWLHRIFSPWRTHSQGCKNTHSSQKISQTGYRWNRTHETLGFNDELQVVTELCVQLTIDDYHANENGLALI